MELLLAAKSTKPGSKATARRGTLVNGKPPRVPVGELHFVDPDAQSHSSAMYDAICGESGLMVIDGELEDFPNDSCATCADQKWAQDFSEMQNKLLK